MRPTNWYSMHGVYSLPYLKPRAIYNVVCGLQVVAKYNNWEFSVLFQLFPQLNQLCQLFLVENGKISWTAIVVP